MTDQPNDPAAPAPTAADAGETKKKQGTDWWAELKAIFWLVVAVLAFHTFIAKPFYIPSESMMPGLLKGDRLVVTKYPYGWSWVSPSFHVLPPIKGRLFGRMPERGDVVILTPPGETSDYIKRVIGLPGDRIEIDRGAVIVNGQRLVENYVPEEYRDRVSLEPETVPSDEYFVLGDHRSSSNDSRSWGFVPRRYIYGKAVFVYWPLDKIGVLR
jgi:signal peptidase I